MHLVEATTSRLPDVSRAHGPLGELVAALDRHGLRYCHWKGNASLGSALNGRKDFDLLVDATAAPKIAAILADLGFRRLAETAGRGFPGIEHHLGFDADRGTLVHVHLHTQLIPTKGNPEWVRLPWEDPVLSTRVRDERYGIDVPAPELELLLLLVRSALRLRVRHRVAEALGRPFFGPKAMDELRWLVSRTNFEDLERRATALVGARAARLVAVVARDRPTAGALVELRSSMEPSPNVLRANGPLESVRTRLRSANRARRTLTAGGRLIVFLGSDGAGKSTVVRAIGEWLGAQLDVRSVYFGSGDGASSLLRRSLRAIDSARRALIGRGRGRSRAIPEKLTADYVLGERYVAGVKPGLRALWKIASKLSLAREKRDRLGAAMRWRTRGAVVICDRYPQTQQTGFNDGPLLGPWLDHPSMLFRAAARRELSAYRVAAALPPDLVIKLVVSPEVAAARKDDMSLELLGTRGAAVRALKFSAPSRVVEIDADQPLANVLATVRRAIWEAI